MGLAKTSKHTNDFIITNCDTHCEEIYEDAMRNKILQRDINLLKCSICAEPNRRAAIGDSWKQEREVSRRGKSKCEGPQVQKKSLESSGV